MPVKLSKFNDGVVSIYQEIERKTDFSAKKNVSTLSDLKLLGKLDFEEMSKRNQDLEFAEQSGFSLSMKIKTRYIKEVTNKNKAVIDGYLYDIRYIDKTKLEMYLYLEGVKPIA
jgi:SPP1 family predicted phage head-tail adaptor